jgi:hypothetical protein
MKSDLIEKESGKLFLILKGKNGGNQVAFYTVLA